MVRHISNNGKNIFLLRCLILLCDEIQTANPWVLSLQHKNILNVLQFLYTLQLQYWLYLHLVYNTRNVSNFVGHLRRCTFILILWLCWLYFPIVNMLCSVLVIVVISIFYNFFRSFLFCFLVLVFLYEFLFTLICPCVILMLCCFITCWYCSFIWRQLTSFVVWF